MDPSGGMTAGSAIGSGGAPACRRGEPPPWPGLRGLLPLELLLPWLMASRDRRRMATSALDAARSVGDAEPLAAASAPAFGLVLLLRGPRVKLLTAWNSRGRG
jgi:hypothetical protein